VKTFIVAFLFFFLVVSVHGYVKRVILASFSTKQSAENMMQKLPNLSPRLYQLSKKYDFEIKMKPSGKYHIIYVEISTDRKILNKALRELRKYFPNAYLSTQTFTQKELDVSNKSLDIKQSKVLATQKNSKEVIETVQKIVLNKQDALPKESELKPINLKNEEKSLVKTQTKNIASQELKTPKPIQNDKEVLDTTTEENLTKDEEKVLHQDFEPKLEKKILSTLNFGVIWILETLNWVYLFLFIIAMIIFYYYKKFKKVYDQY